MRRGSRGDRAPFVRDIVVIAMSALDKVRRLGEPLRFPAGKIGKTTD
jgi:hypothetical protein